MSDTTSPGKNHSGRKDTEKTHFAASAGLRKSDRQHPPAEARGTKTGLTCIAVKESDRQEIMGRMSPESQKILAGTQWSESGFIPSFEATDKILMKAARRTYSDTPGSCSQ